MKKFLFLLVFLNFYNSLNGQTDKSPFYQHKNYNKIYLELAGQARIYSFNYERVVESRNAWFPSWKAGVSYVETLVFPLGIDFNKQISDTKQVTLGIGASMRLRTQSIFSIPLSFKELTSLLLFSEYQYSIKFGYQFSPEKSNWFFGASLNPIFYETTLFVVGRSRSGEFNTIFNAGLQIGVYL